MQWKFKPASDQWSTAEILEHVVIVRERVLGPIWELLATAPPWSSEEDTIDRLVINEFPARLRKFTAPEIVPPTGRIAPAESLEQFATHCAQPFELLESTPDLRAHAIPSPPLKAVSQGAYELMDGYQWLLAVAAHTERHTKQILDVKADPKYPQQ